MGRGVAALSVMISILTVACGYHAVGHGATIPEDVRTVAIPAFANDSSTYKIEQRLTAAVVREMTTRTHYHIINENSADADATLRGTVLSTTTTPLTYDSQSGRVASVLVVVNISVKMTDRHGKVLYQNPSYLFRDQYQVTSDLNSFFEEDSPAFQRLSRDFAQTLVSNLLEGF